MGPTEYRVITKPVGSDEWEVVAEYLSMGEAREAIKDCIKHSGLYYTYELSNPGLKRLTPSASARWFYRALSDERVVEIVLETPAGEAYLIQVQPPEEGR